MISRVQHDMEAIDEDGSGTIDRVEWMMYLVTPDQSTNLESYDLHLRALFDKFDTDRNGKIDQDELEQFLQSYYWDYI